MRGKGHVIQGSEPLRLSRLVPTRTTVTAGQKRDNHYAAAGAETGFNRTFNARGPGAAKGPGIIPIHFIQVMVAKARSMVNPVQLGLSQVYDDRSF